jgi:hypothetical protein
MLNEDYRDMLHALSDEKVRFMLIGAYAMAAHGFPRASMDIDIWIMPRSPEASSILASWGTTPAQTFSSLLSMRRLCFLS